jgi:hypothetical protein
LDVSVTSTPTLTPANINSSSAGIGRSVSKVPEVSAREIAFNLALWLAGLESFARIRTSAFAETNQTKNFSRDWSREFHLTHLALLDCSNLALRLAESLRVIESKTEIVLGDKSAVAEKHFEFSFEEIFAFAADIKNLVVLNDVLLRGAPHKLGEWNSWSEILNNFFRQSEIFAKVIQSAEQEAGKHLPKELLELLKKTTLAPEAKAELTTVLPYLAKILQWLEVVGKMIRDDEPLKPSLLIFARVYEQTQEMMNYIRRRLLRFASEEDSLYEVLDCALYAASIELRKVFNFELAGLSEMRQPISIRAKIETSHALLNDCLRLVLVQFAQFIEPHFEPTRLFPGFQTKLEQSLSLREDLWRIQQMVQKAEQEPNNALLEKLNDRLTVFLSTSMRFLMYKDCETFERFAEEVMRTRNKKDLVPILHRFGAYLETLFGQVNMRTVLANFPFDYPQEKL